MRIAFFDIDGTLATGTDVPASAEAALARMRAQGDLVFICTGRPRGYVERHFGRYADGFVCSNGRLCVRGDERLIDAYLSEAEVRELIAILEEAGAGYAFFGERELWYGGNPAYRHVAEGANGPHADLVDPAAIHAYSFDIYFADAAERDTIAAALEGKCLVNPHGPHPSADVTVLGHGKGEAVRDVAAALGVDLSDTYAFGDGINDLSMIEAAGHGIAMGNAVPEVKAAAEYVTADITADGVALAMQHYGLA